jgi:hypothetical protein
VARLLDEAEVDALKNAPISPRHAQGARAGALRRGSIGVRQPPEDVKA